MITIHHSMLQGLVAAPASKSFAQRAVAASLLCTKKGSVIAESISADFLASLDAAEKLGAEVTQRNKTYSIEPGAQHSESDISCGESGLSFRLFVPLAASPAFFKGKKSLTVHGKGSLLKRPMEFLVEPMKQLGSHVETSNGFAPVTILSPLKGGRADIDASLSSQLLSGLLMALPICPKDSELRIHQLVSHSYIDITLEILESYGIHIENQSYNTFFIPGQQQYSAQSFAIEGDWSNTAFLLVAAALHGPLTVKSVNLASVQGDKKILDVLKAVGAGIRYGYNSVTVERQTLSAFEFDAANVPDLFPPLVALAAFCDGTSIIHGVHRLIHKESNRSESLQQEFAKLGVSVVVKQDSMFIKPDKEVQKQLQTPVCFSHNDHRIAMACSIAGMHLHCGVSIDGERAVDKSYPEFFAVLQALGGKLDE